MGNYIKIEKKHQTREKAFLNNICSNTTQYFTLPHFFTREKDTKLKEAMMLKKFHNRAKNFS